MDYGPVSPKISRTLLHGGDYNPEQWLDRPDILKQDLEFMKLAGVNVVSVGIFSWSALEPDEGVFCFGWLDEIIDNLWENGVYVILATPSGARPAWMAMKYEEVRRVNGLHLREHYGDRHNHCYTSPVYREKTAIINKKLAERYSGHPAVIMWHISNEYGGACHCPLCQAEFRKWLEKRYGTVENLNKAWWSAFWSHSFRSFDEIESPSEIGDTAVLCQNIDWDRFVSYQTADFMKHEIAVVKSVDPTIPVTANFMREYRTLDYFKLAKELDVCSWDSYPLWHKGNDADIAAQTAMWHDVTRSLKGGRPFLLMESSPSMTNWQPVSKLKRPGMHMLSSLQAVAHGSDSVQYFQWRKGRGSYEKLHGAVVDHNCDPGHRVFRDVSEVGDLLKMLSGVAGTGINAQVAIIYDWENRWGVEHSRGPRNCGIKYMETIRAHYRAFWNMGISVDFCDMDPDCDFSKYKLVIAPMLYMLRGRIAERLTDFVKNGGTLAATYWTGITDENDLCFTDGFPGPLKPVLGIAADEIDALYDGEYNSMAFAEGNCLGMSGNYKLLELCELIRTGSAETLAVYESDFYAGYPVLTKNDFGKGCAYYIAARSGQDFLDNFYASLAEKINIERALSAPLPEGVSAARRIGGGRSFLFLMNFNPYESCVLLDRVYTDCVTGGKAEGKLTLAGYGLRVLEEK